jgi:hypothetical protein
MIKFTSATWRTVLSRWISILFLTLLATTVVILAPYFLHFNLLQVVETLEQMNWVYQFTVLMLVFVLLWWFVIQLGGMPSLGNLFKRSTLLYPPFWLPLPIAAALIWMIAPHLGKVTENAFRQPVWTELWFPAFVVLGGAAVAKIIDRALRPTKLRPLKKGLQQQPTQNVAPVLSPEVIMKWIENDIPIQTIEEDFLGRTSVAERIAKTINGSCGTTMCLVGPYGSGKSSILNLVEQHLDEKIILVNVSAWGIQREASAETILRAVVGRLSFYVDCSSLYRLPSQYQASIGAGPGWWKALTLFTLSQSDPLEILTTIDRILAVIDRKLIIFLEDLDRNWQEGTFWTEVISLLDRLKKLRHVSYVLAISEPTDDRTLLCRISDHVELVPAMRVDTVAEIYSSFMRECKKPFNDLEDYEEDKHLERIGVYRSIQQDQIDDMLGQDPGTPIRVFTSLILHPRNLKHILRRTHRTWLNLHGEIDFEDVFAANLLRVAFPAVLVFINENIRSIRQLAKEDKTEVSDRIRKELRGKLDRCLPEIAPERIAVESVLEFLFPHWKDGFVLEHEVAQGVAPRPEPTDYWNRLIEENISQGELHDQEVMRAILAWKKNSANPAYGKLTLAEAITEIPDFPEKVKQFGDRLEGQDVCALAGELFRLTYLPDRPLRKPGEGLRDVPGESEMLYLASQKSIPGYGEWVLNEASRLLEINLSAAVHVYQQWLHPLLQPGLEEVRRLRDAFLSSARDRYSNVETFIRAIRYSTPAATHRFIQLVNNPRYGSGEEYMPSEWEWLKKCLLSAQRIDQIVAIPQIVILAIGQDRTSSDYNLKWNDVYLNAVFGESVPSAMEVLKNIDPNQYGDEIRGHIVFAREEATKRLSRQQGDVSSVLSTTKGNDSSNSS